MDSNAVAVIAAVNGYALSPDRANAIASATEASLALFDDIARGLPFEAEPTAYAAATAEGARQ